MKPQLYSDEREGWKRHSSRTRPVPSSTVIEPWFAFGKGRRAYEARKLNWAAFNEETAIIGYRVVGS